MHISLVIYLLWKTAQSPSVFPEEHLYPERWPLESLFDLRLVDFYQDSYFLGKHGKVGELNMPVRWETQRRQLNETYQMTVTCFTRRSPKRCRKCACRKNGIWETIQVVHSSPADYGQKENKRPVIQNLCWGQHVTHTFSESSNRWTQGTEVWVPSTHAGSEVVTEHIGCWGQWWWTRKAVSNFSMERWLLVDSCSKKTLASNTLRS